MRKLSFFGGSGEHVRQKFMVENRFENADGK